MPRTAAAAPRPLRAVVYVRLSVHRGETDPSVSPGAQEERCRAYAAAKGWDVVEVVRDLDVSGSDKGLRLDRPGLRAVRALLPDVDVVIFAKLDRLARNVIDFRAFADEVAEHDAALVSVAESLDLSTPSGRFVATILASFAEMEAATIADRVTAARSALAGLHRYAGGSVPYGYVSVPHPSGAGRALAVEPAEALVLTEIAERIVAGETLYAITGDLNARGLTTKRGKEWRLTTVRDYVTSDAVVGRLTHRGEIVRDAAGLPVQAWPPALDPSLWREARAALDRTPATPSAAPKPARTRAARLLSGIVSCGSCGGPLYVRHYAAGVTYACMARSHGRSCDKGVTMRADRLESLAEERLLGMVGTWPTFRVVTDGDVVARARLAETEEAIEAVMAALRDATDEETERALLAQRRALRADVEALRAAADAPVTREIPTGRTFAEEWAEHDVAGRRALLARWVDALVLHPAPGRSTKPDPERVEIVWTGAGEPDLDDAAGPM